MGLDIRMPMGLMFSAFGAILLVYGLLSDRTIYARSLGINVNGLWGAVLLVFGLIMLFLGLRGNARARHEAEKKANTPNTLQATQGN